MGFELQNILLEKWLLFCRCTTFVNFFQARNKIPLSSPNDKKLVKVINSNKTVQIYKICECERASYGTTCARRCSVNELNSKFAIWTPKHAELLARFYLHFCHWYRLTFLTAKVAYNVRVTHPKKQLINDKVKISFELDSKYINL